MKAGIPSQLLTNRPDIRQAEYELAAAGLDIQSARANFLPSFGIRAGLGFQAFNLKYTGERSGVVIAIPGRGRGRTGS